MVMVKDGSTIQSLQIGIGIVESIAKQRKPMRFADIQQLTQITKSNLYKYLNTLTHLGILYRDKESGAYTLGSKMIEFGMVALDQENIIDRVTPYLHEISQYSSCTVLLSVWSQNGPIVVKMVTSRQGLNIGAEIGTLLPILSATGKVFATFMEEYQIREWRERELELLPPGKSKTLADECRFVAANYISFAREPLVQHVSSVALPIFNYKQNLLGAVTVVGFSDSIPHTLQDPFSGYLLKVSGQMSRNLGYEPFQASRS